MKPGSRRAAIIGIPKNALADLCGIREAGMEIHSMHPNYDTDTIDFVVTSDKLPEVPEGSSLMRLKPLFYSGVRRIVVDEGAFK